LWFLIAENLRFLGFSKVEVTQGCTFWMTPALAVSLGRGSVTACRQRPQLSKGSRGW
jgi:hypothetical protein